MINSDIWHDAGSFVVPWDNQNPDLVPGAMIRIMVRARMSYPEMRLDAIEVRMEGDALKHGCRERVFVPVEGAQKSATEYYAIFVVETNEAGAVPFVIYQSSKIVSPFKDGRVVAFKIMEVKV